MSAQDHRAAGTCVPTVFASSPAAVSSPALLSETFNPSTIFKLAYKNSGFARGGRALSSFRMATHVLGGGQSCDKM
jgi:hypothetical protein